VVARLAGDQKQYLADCHWNEVIKMTEVGTRTSEIFNHSPPTHCSASEGSHFGTHPPFYHILLS